MTHIVLHEVSVGFPILHLAHRSLKKSLVATMTGGTIVREAHKPPFVRALHNVTADFEAGDRIGLIGPNGAGKSTLLRTIAGIYEPMSGQMSTQGTITSLMDVMGGFLPELTGRENIKIRGMYSGMRPSVIAGLTPEIEKFTELGEYLDMPIRTYSSGMLLRLAFAVVTSRQPDILLMDEWVLAGDAAFLGKAQARMEQFVSNSSILVLASHSDALIRKWCNKALYLSGGELRVVGKTDDVLAAYAAELAEAQS
jgi:ABC-type polysaccharide/polyol phosphate transport system ATPase subunit